MSPRKFYRSVIEIEVLSEEPRVFETLDDLEHEIVYGDCSGLIVDKILNQVIDAKTCARRLLAQGSAPEFFNLDEAGNETSLFSKGV